MGEVEGVSSRPKGFKLGTPHREGCWTEGSDKRFVVHDRTIFNRSKSGARGGNTMWHVFLCNDPDCPAEMYVRWDVLAEFIDEATT